MNIVGRYSVRVLLAVLFLFSLKFQAAGQDSVRVGSKAPDFTLRGATRDSILSKGVQLSSTLSSAPVILAFYPADWSSGCTTEMCTMRDNFAALADLHATVFGISGDYMFAHHEWAKQLNLPFTLLSDHDHAVAKEYQSFNPKSGFNQRTIFVVDRSGNIAYVDRAYNTQSRESFDKLRNALTGMRQ